MAKRVHLSSAVLIGSLLHAGTVSALGLGDITLNSYLNEPLDAEVRLNDTRDLVVDEIKVRLARVEDFERLGVERSYFLTRIQFEVSIDRDSNTGVIRLTTSEPVLEPFVDVIIEARWPSGRLLREYTVLVDPPVFREEPVIVSASEEVAAAESAQRRPDDASAAAADPDTGEDGAGGQVVTGGSELPPGEMPQRSFSAETSEFPAPGQRYMVRRDETLWQIASRGRPQGVSVQQAMLDIQRLNPEAFINGNINRVKAGYIIYLPGDGDISSGNFSEALAEVQQQNADWASQQAGTPGVTAAASLHISADPADGVDAPLEAEPSRQVTDASAAGGTADDAASSTPVGRQRASEEPATSDLGDEDAPAGQATAQGELAGQLAEMSERLDTLEQIVALKDEQIATLEQALQEARLAAQQAPSAQVETAEPPAVAPPQSRPVAETPAPEPVPQAVPGLLERLGSWLYAIAAVLLLALLGLLFWRRRRDQTMLDDDSFDADGVHDDDSDDVFAGVTLRDEPAAQKPPTLPVVPLDSAELQQGSSDAVPPRNNRGYGERRYDDYIDDSGAGDALAEADIYIAYGRYLQAAELLTTAIQAEPDNAVYRLKLIELYVDMGEPDKAREQLDALSGLGDADAMRRAEAIVGSSVEPGPHDIESGVATEPDVASEPELVPEPQSEIETESQRQRAPETEWPPEPAPLPSTPDDSGSQSESVPETPAEPESPEDTWLRSYQEPATDPAPAGRMAGSPSPTAREDSVEDARDDTPGDRPMEEVEYEPLEFSLDDVSPADDADGVAGLGASAGDSLPGDASRGPQSEEAPELELDFDELAIEDDRPAATANLEDDELDLSEALREAETPDERSRDDGGGEEPGSDEMVFATDADQIATKLDLARAYLDMGDDDGARRILEQVLSAGSEAQEREARALLDRIG